MEIAKSSIMTLITGLLFLFPANGYGQEMLSTEQEIEIKLSGNYYFGECMAFDESEAKDCALKELTQEVIVSALQQLINEKKEILLKNMEMKVNTARLPMSGSIKILAYISKDSIYAQNSSVDDNEIVKTDETDQNTEPQTEISKEELQPSSNDENSFQPIIANPVVKDLADGSTYDGFKRKADSWRRKGKLVYGSRKTSFLLPDKCHIAVFSSSGTLIALLGEGNNLRIDLLTGKSVQNPEQQYSESKLIWIQIN